MLNLGLLDSTPQPGGNIAGCFQTRRIQAHAGRLYVFPDEAERADKGLGIGSIQFESPQTVDGSVDPIAVLDVNEKTMRVSPVQTWQTPTAFARLKSLAPSEVRAKMQADTRRPKTRPVILEKKRGAHSYFFWAPAGAKFARWEPGKRLLWVSKHAERFLNPLTKDQALAIQYARSLASEHRTPDERALELASRGAIFVINHSGGKDSQAMYLKLTRELKIPRRQIRVVHADLPDADWPGTLDHIRATVDENVSVVTGNWKDGSIKKLADYVRHRSAFPSPQQRWCTSDLKTAPIDKWMRNTLCKINNLPPKCNLARSRAKTRVVVMCLGMRAQESDNRAGLMPWALNVGDSLSGRIVFDYLPIFAWSEAKVFREIKRCGQAPFWIYGQTTEHQKMLEKRGSVDNAGNPVPMTRMSCVYCIMGSLQDLGVASLIAPDEAAKQICDLEVETGHTFRKGVKMPALLERGRAAVKSGKKTRKRLKVVTTEKRKSGPC